MNKSIPTAIFLGAGASRAFGYPTTVELVDKIDSVTHKRELLGHTVEYLRNKSNSKIVDIESILWELDDLQNWIQELKSKDKFKREYIYHSNEYKFRNSHLEYRFKEILEQVESLRRDSYETVYHAFWEEQQGDYEKCEVTYSKFFSNFNIPLNIFTTNYDLCVEKPFWQGLLPNERLCDGFEYNGIDTIFNFDSYNNNNDFNLYKLHGSVNWKLDPMVNGKIHRLNRHDFTKLEDHPLLFPGEKYIEKHPFSLLYNKLGKVLKEVKFLIVIGFSFRDEILNKLFLSALKDNYDLKIVIWNVKLPDHKFPKERVIQFLHPFGLKSISRFFKDIYGEDYSID